MKRETSPETIERVLSTYEVGRKLRQLRLRKKIALADLGKHTGLSPSMLSQLENGRMIPTLPTLARIAMVFDVGLDHFFGGQRARKLFSVIRSQERMRFPERPDAPSPSYFFECLDLRQPGQRAAGISRRVPPPRCRSRRRTYSRRRRVSLSAEGTLTIRFQDEDHELRAGDSVVLDPTEPHSYRGSGKSRRPRPGGHAPAAGLTETGRRGAGQQEGPHVSRAGSRPSIRSRISSRIIAMKAGCPAAVPARTMRIPNSRQSAAASVSKS